MREYQTLSPVSSAERTEVWEESARFSSCSAIGHQRRLGCSHAGGDGLCPQPPAAATAIACPLPGARCQVPNCGRSLQSGYRVGFYCQVICGFLFLRCGDPSASLLKYRCAPYAYVGKKLRHARCPCITTFLTGHHGGCMYLIYDSVVRAP